MPSFMSQDPDPRERGDLHIRMKAQGGYVFEGTLPLDLPDREFKTSAMANDFALERGYLSTSYRDNIIHPIFYRVPQICCDAEGTLYNPLHGGDAGKVSHIKTIEREDIREYENDLVFWSVFTSGLDSYGYHISDFPTEKDAIECLSKLYERLI